jgi:hypothetical protein
LGTDPDDDGRACDISGDLQVVQRIVYQIIELDPVESFKVSILAVGPAEQTGSRMITTIVLCLAEPNFPERNASCVVPAVRLKVNLANVETRMVECF